MSRQFLQALDLFDEAAAHVRRQIEVKGRADEIVSAPAEALVIPMTEDIACAVKTATVLRDAGVRTQLYTEKKKFKARMSYASKLGFPYTVLIGEDEIAEGVVALKDMQSGEQRKVPAAEAAEIIRSAMDAKANAAVIKE